MSNRINAKRYSCLFIANFLIWLAVSSSVVAQPCVAPASGLVSWWPADRNTADIVGTNSGSREGVTTYAQGKTGSAFSFTGINDDVIVSGGNDLNPGTGSFTIEAWIKSTGKRTASGNDTGIQTIVSKYQLAPTPITQAYFFAVNPNGGLDLFLRDATGQTQTLTGVRNVADNQFHHVVAVRDTGTFSLRLYVDGVLDAMTLIGAALNVTPTDVPFRIGNRFALPFVPEHFTGLIDEVGYYNRALTNAEILAIFSAGAAGKCKATGTTVCDDELIKAKEKIVELQAQIDQINNGLARIQTDFRNVFNDPEFSILGDTPLQRFESLVEAILRLEKGRKMGVYKNLGGKKN